MRMAVVGSPGYFARHARLSTPQDLTEHDCLCMRLPTHAGLMAWEFKRRGGSLNAHVKGRVVFNRSDLMVAAALTDHGLIWVPADIVEEHVVAGRLILVLDDWAITYPGYHLYYGSRHASPALTLVVEALRYSGHS